MSLAKGNPMDDMDRRKFLEMSTLLGLGSVLGTGFGVTDAEAARFKGKVLVIGAGAAGLSAGLHLKKMGIPFTVLEASGGFGGRMKVNRGFADFPIPLGAEWLHTSPGVFSKIAGSGASVKTVGYKSSDRYLEVSGGEASESRLGGYRDRKFVNSSWYDFFRQFVHPVVSSNIRYGQSVSRIDYSGNQVQVSTRSGGRFTADKVLVTVPLKMLQSGSIRFQPALPSSKQSAIRSAKAWPGLKMFIQFSKKFYPTFVEYDLPISQGMKAYYDAAYGQNSNRAILGLFTVGNAALPFMSGNARGRAIAELDKVFDGQASRYYVKHMVQNWSAEPNIRAAYLRDNERVSTVKALYKPVGRKIFFAGEAYTSGNDWGSVHTAALAAKSAIKKLVSSG
ncbi:MAG: FAD-dependent oxidoreductase [Pseudomonadota bacterium]